MRILLVDDEIAILECLGKQLRAEGHDVSCVLMQDKEGARKVLDLLFADQFDAAVIDLIMPLMDGMEVAGWVRELAPKTRIIMCDRSTDFGPQMVRQGQADAFLLEPFEADEVREALASYPESNRGATEAGS